MSLLDPSRTKRPTGPPRPIAPLVQQVDLNRPELQDSNRFRDAEGQQAEVADSDDEQKLLVDTNVMKIELSQVGIVIYVLYTGLRRNAPSLSRVGRKKVINFKY